MKATLPATPPNHTYYPETPLAFEIRRSEINQAIIELWSQTERLFMWPNPDTHPFQYPFVFKYLSQFQSPLNFESVRFEEHVALVKFRKILGQNTKDPTVSALLKKPFWINLDQFLPQWSIKSQIHHTPSLQRGNRDLFLRVESFGFKTLTFQLQTQTTLLFTLHMNPNEKRTLDLPYRGVIFAHNECPIFSKESAPLPDLLLVTDRSIYSYDQNAVTYFSNFAPIQISQNSPIVTKPPFWITFQREEGVKISHTSSFTTYQLQEEKLGLKIELKVLENNYVLNFPKSNRPGDTHTILFMDGVKDYTLAQVSDLCKQLLEAAPKIDTLFISLTSTEQNSLAGDEYARLLGSITSFLQPEKIFPVGFDKWPMTLCRGTDIQSFATYLNLLSPANRLCNIHSQKYLY